LLFEESLSHQGAAMARYCFHAYSGICFAQDFEVQDLPSLEAARGAARHVADHFWVYLPRHLRQESLTIEIEEEAGQGYASVCFPGRERR
jgi:hypothetical protein